MHSHLHWMWSPQGEKKQAPASSLLLRSAASKEDASLYKTFPWGLDLRNTGTQNYTQIFAFKAGKMIPSVKNQTLLCCKVRNLQVTLLFSLAAEGTNINFS